MSYNRIIERVFLDRFQPGDSEVELVREDLIDVTTDLGVPVPKNLGDVLYTFRYRRPLPKGILETAPPGKEWTIRGAGQSVYTFRLVTVNRIVPNPALMTIKIPDPCRTTCEQPLVASDRSRSTRSTSPWTAQAVRVARPSEGRERSVVCRSVGAGLALVP